MAYQYAREVFPQASFLRLGLTYPLPKRLLREFAAQVERLIVIEELDPFVEEAIRLLGIRVEGKSIFPLSGEFDPTLLRSCARKAGLIEDNETDKTIQMSLGPLPARPPVLCPGCPHRGVFVILKKLKLVVHGDIGCYTLGYLPPLDSVHTCGCMGASIGVAHGAHKVGTKQTAVAVIGDSTFCHTGLHALLNVAYNRGDLVTIIMDNRTTAMTGHQENPATGHTLDGKPTFSIDFVKLAQAMGIKHASVVDSYDLDQLERTLRAAIKSGEPTVILAQRECALLPSSRREWQPLKVEAAVCNGCGLCFAIGCPAFIRSDQADPKTHRFLAHIDPLLCTGCEICAQVCRRGAILKRDQVVPETII